MSSSAGATAGTSGPAAPLLMLRGVSKEFANGTVALFVYLLIALSELRLRRKLDEYPGLASDQHVSGVTQLPARLGSWLTAAERG